jgi:hypothetical protein
MAAITQVKLGFIVILSPQFIAKSGLPSPDRPSVFPGIR